MLGQHIGYRFPVMVQMQRPTKNKMLPVCKKQDIGRVINVIKYKK